ncbi:MAG TPA: tetratricopeptide repeat protein [Pyrinomonadaceae bacterium]|nr:tetratricopeptide repeat protein [Pyrinomonadaceae bacterium]
MFGHSRIICTTILLFLLAPVFTLAISAQAQNSVSASQPRPSISVLDSTREQDGLVGSVRRVKIESAKIEVLDGRTVEGPRQLLELTTYGFNGSRLENISYPSADSVIGKEEYKYDDRGNIIEMTLRNDRGAIVNREAYSYEFDTFGNWTKMFTSLVVFENGQVKREPVEVTYRTVTYYFNDSIANIVDQPASRKLPSAAAAIVLQPPSLETSKIDANASWTTNVSASALEPIGAPPPLAKPQETEKPVASRQTGNDESNIATRAARAEAVTVRFFKESPATNPTPPEAPEAKRKQNVSVSTAPSNSSTTESSSAEGSPVNFKPGARTALDYYQTGLAHLDAGDVKAAVEAYLESIKLEPNSAQVFFNLGEAYLKLKKDSDAAKAFKESVRLNPEVAEAQYGLGLASYNLKRFPEAAVGFRKAIKLNPKMAKAHFGLGLVYLELDNANAVLQEQRVLEALDKDLAKRLAQTLPTLPCKVKPFCQ